MADIVARCIEASDPDQVAARGLALTIDTMTASISGCAQRRCYGIALTMASHPGQMAAVAMELAYDAA